MNKTIHSKEYSELLKWLRAQRKQQGLTMRELGEKLGVIHSWVGKIEQGERRLDIIEYLRLCNALQIDPNEGLELVQQSLSVSNDLS
ncbi:MAG: helix-turn-helix transcriptional regulator [Kiritimatiellales bacterium]|nr:helix-turn-helix transcriptional regulator [Kiritimatiellota bacterium]MBL7011811.1 helix-turn-helix transcriptional regulator [Kiritimatiellales bacterium]